MKPLAVVFAILFLLGGIGLALYVGVWLMLVGGIVQIVEAFKATPVESMGVAIGIVKILCASPVGWVIVAINLLIARGFCALAGVK